MRVSIMNFLIVAVCCLTMSDHASAQSQDISPIRYAVEGNNRLFLDGESDRYVEDLHRYLRCEARKDGEYINSDQDCTNYRKRGNAALVETVPDLRGGAAEDFYRVRYDKDRNAHPPGYAMDGRRSVRFFLSEEWWSKNSTEVTGCDWSFDTASGVIELPSPDCGPVRRDIGAAIGSGRAIGTRGTFHRGGDLLKDRKNFLGDGEGQRYHANAAPEVRLDIEVLQQRRIALDDGWFSSQDDGIASGQRYDLDRAGAIGRDDALQRARHFRGRSIVETHGAERRIVAIKACNHFAQADKRSAVVNHDK